MSSGTRAQLWIVVVGAAVTAAVSAGRFLVSWRVGHSPTGDASGEALGVVSVLLVIVSAVGASRRDRPDDDGSGDG